ncbi:restriction endonuclease subunit S, partial [Capnocytophaga granulosa]
TPYEKLPKGWAWCRLGEVCCFENGYAFNSDDYQKNGTPLIRISNIKNGKIDISEAVFIKIEYDKRFMVEYGDLLIAMSGATTGKMGVYKLDREAVLNQRVGNIKIRNKDIFFHKFRNYIMQTKSNEILKMAYGGAQPNISGKMIENLTIPLPPLAEQYRIVQKIETYFSFLDAIENSL